MATVKKNAEKQETKPQETVTGNFTPDDLPVLKNIQDFINTRAEQKLRKDLESMSQLLIGMKLLFPSQYAALYSFPLLSFQNRNATVKELFTYKEVNNQVQSTEYMAELYNYWLPIYKADETREVMQAFSKLNFESNPFQESAEENPATEKQPNLFNND